MLIYLVLKYPQLQLVLKTINVEKSSSKQLHIFCRNRDAYCRKFNQGQTNSIYLKQ